MREVAADADAFLITLPRSAVVSRKFIAEADMVVRPVNDGRQAFAGGRNIAEEAPSEAHELIRLAIAAAQQERQHVMRQRLDRCDRDIGRETIRRAYAAVKTEHEQMEALKHSLEGQRDAANPLFPQ